MPLKDWVPIITLIFSTLVVPALGLVLRLVSRQTDQKSELTATNVQVEQVKKDVGAVKEDVKTLAGKLDDHGKLLYEIKGILSPGPTKPSV